MTSTRVPIRSHLTLDWPPGEQGHLRYVNADGNVIFGGFRARSVDPILSLRGYSLATPLTTSLPGRLTSAAVA